MNIRVLYVLLLELKTSRKNLRLFVWLWVPSVETLTFKELPDPNKSSSIEIHSKILILIRSLFLTKTLWNDFELGVGIFNIWSISNVSY